MLLAKIIFKVVKAKKSIAVCNFRCCDVDLCLISLIKTRICIECFLGLFFTMGNLMLGCEGSKTILKHFWENIAIMMPFTTALAFFM